ncbi:cytochrome c oxidase accessory protein CcoG, partial [Aquimarina celericrescens]|nr:cytochrome c oxidase accessory protein CcoG [Aquimarina celericrescens]
CTACIDACDSIMESVDLPKGLIRYASEENIEKKAKFEFTPRLKGYSAVLTILIGFLMGLLLIRSDIEAKVLRLPGQLYEMTKEGKVSNVFTYKLLNKTNVEMDSIHFKINSFD